MADLHELVLPDGVCIVHMHQGVPMRPAKLILVLFAAKFRFPPERALKGMHWRTYERLQGA